MAQTYQVRSFAFGEVSQKAAGRTDLAWYQQACKTLSNMFAYSIGYAEKRPGTRFVAATKTAGAKVRFFRWKLTQTSYIVIEAGNLYFRFFKNGAPIGAPYELTSPYATADLEALRMIQIGTTGYFVHPSYAPRKLTYTSDTSWAFSTPTFAAGTGEESFGSTGHYPSKVELFQDRLIFAKTTLKPGTFWGSRTSTYENFSLRRNATVTTPVASPGIVNWTGHGQTVNNSVSFTTTGALPTGLLPGVAYYVLAAGLTADSFQVAATPGGTAINFTGATSGTHTGWATPPLATDAWEKTPQAQAGNEILWLLSDDALLFGTSEGTFKAASKGEALNPDVAWWPTRQTANGTSEVEALMVDDFACFASRDGRRLFKFQYQDTVDKYIADEITQVAEHITGSGVEGMAHQREPVTCLWIWTKDGTLAAAQYDRAMQSIAWCQIDVGGLVESLVVIPTDGEDQVWISVVREVGGTEYRYVEYFSPRAWAEARDYNGTDSSVLWDGGAAKDVTSISAAAPGVCSCTAHGFSNDDLVRFSGVTGAVPEVNGRVFTVKNATTDSFELYTRDGASPFEFTTAGTGGAVERVTNEISGLDHLEGLEVRTQGDGAQLADEVVASGEITLDDYVNKAFVGLPYMARLSPMPVSEARNKLKSVLKVFALFYKTSGAAIGTDSAHMDNIEFQDEEPDMDTPPPPDTDLEYVFMPGYAEFDGTVIVESDAPLPMTLLSLMYEIKVER
jgi:hypothetical protein